MPTGELKMSKMYRPSGFVEMSMCMMWLGGIVLAQGWYKLLAVVLPPYSLYLFVRRLMELGGMCENYFSGY